MLLGFTRTFVIVIITLVEAATAYEIVILMTSGLLEESVQEVVNEPNRHAFGNALVSEITISWGNYSRAYPFPGIGFVV